MQIGNGGDYFGRALLLVSPPSSDSLFFWGFYGQIVKMWLRRTIEFFLQMIDERGNSWRDVTWVLQWLGVLLGCVCLGSVLLAVVDRIGPTLHWVQLAEQQKFMIGYD